MRVRSPAGSELSVHAIAGTHVVLLGFDLPEADAARLMGFAIERTDHNDHTSKKTGWLMGYRHFSEEAMGLPSVPPLPPGAPVQPMTPVSTRDHPIQGFMWGDYRAKPDHKYTYRVLALEGKPGSLTQFAETSVTVDTESETHDVHGVFFNLGAAASQAWIEKFGHQTPDKVPNRAGYKWLSRGLEEALLRFINGATGPGHALRGALYEFEYEPVLKALGDAHTRGVDVKLVIDEKRNQPNDNNGGPHGGPRDPNLTAIGDTGIGDLVIPREADPNAIAHHKFIVHLENGAPVAVWTGSTNITEGGIFGHSNVGHEVRDAAVAAQYLRLWEDQLSHDPKRAVLRPWNDALPLHGADPDRPEPGITPIFSPRTKVDALDWYAHLMDLAANSVFFTAAFGVSAQLRTVLNKNKPYLRYALVEKSDQQVELLKGDRNNRFSVGAKVDSDYLGKWAEEQLSGFNTFVKYIHTKFMLIDPLSDDPIVITGSANFSEASSTTNDENMLVIRGSTRVADIYLTEFMRLFNHFYFRDQIPPKPKPGQPPVAFKKWDPDLRPKPTWAHDYYVPAYYRCKERELFA